jgi:hypothetical protein
MEQEFAVLNYRASYDYYLGQSFPKNAPPSEESVPTAP